MLLFCVDIIVSFFVGYFDEAGGLVQDSKRVTLNYARCVCGGFKRGGVGR